MISAVSYSDSYAAVVYPCVVTYTNAAGTKSTKAPKKPFATKDECTKFYDRLKKQYPDATVDYSTKVVTTNGSPTSEKDSEF